MWLDKVKKILYGICLTSTISGCGDVNMDTNREISRSVTREIKAEKFECKEIFYPGAGGVFAKEIIISIEDENGVLYRSNAVWPTENEKFGYFEELCGRMRRGKIGAGADVALYGEIRPRRDSILQVDEIYLTDLGD